MPEMTPDRAREVEDQLANAFKPKPKKDDPPLHTVLPSPSPTQVPEPSPYGAFDRMRKR